MRYKELLTFLMILFVVARTQGQILKSTSGYASFRSEASLEVIQASSGSLKGAIDTKKKTFAFSIALNSFKGFNSPLQMTHFNENYMESQKYPKAYFTGKIIEDIDFDSEGMYTIRAKGKLVIHGIKQERIIKAIVRIENKEILVESGFSVLLKEHKIRIPKIVHQKIAEEIFVNIKATLTYPNKL